MRARQPAGIDVHLHAREEKARCVELLVAFYAPRHVVDLARAFSQLDVLALGAPDGRLHAERTPTRPIVVPHEDARRVGQPIKLVMNRMVEGFGAASRKVTTTRSVILHE